MVRSLQVSYWLTLALSLPEAGFMLRIFIIQHDCGHGSFFSSKRANDVVGMISSLITLTPYYYWKKSHAIHHAHVGNLDGRGIGDVQTLTVKEYLQLSPLGKLQYRIYRNPFILFGIIAFLLFVVVYRFPTSRTKTMKSVQSSIYWTNLGIACLVAGLVKLVGWQTFLLVHFPVEVWAASVGTWIFYVQHQYEDTYWEGQDKWDYATAAMKGSSFYKLPPVLQWFSGNIGFHHIHHLSPRIPNYLLPQCHEENPPLQGAVVLTLRTGIRSMILTLWDEEEKKLISFRDLSRKLAANSQTAEVIGHSNVQSAYAD